MSMIYTVDRTNLLFDSRLDLSFPDSFEILQNRRKISNIFYCLYSTPASWMERAKVEEDERYLQIIPYMVITQKGKVLSYRRKKSGDSRLADKMSIGFGGHIEIEDRDKDDWFLSTLENAAKRELKEELGAGILDWIAGDFLPSLPNAMIYDKSNLVGKVHLGLVYILELHDGAKLEFEDSVGDPRWANMETLRLDTSGGYDLETWSELVMDGFFYNNP